MKVIVIYIIIGLVIFFISQIIQKAKKQQHDWTKSLPNKKTTTTASAGQTTPVAIAPKQDMFGVDTPLIRRHSEFQHNDAVVYDNCRIRRLD